MSKDSLLAHGGWYKVPGDRLRELREAAAQRDAIVQKPGKVPGLRWRTLAVDDEEPL